jgi:hypothetical protein
MEGIIALLIIIGSYLLPTLIASARGHRSTAAIGVVNILFGWTFIGWIWALIWSLTGNVRSD